MVESTMPKPPTSFPKTPKLMTTILASVIVVASISLVLYHNHKHNSDKASNSAQQQIIQSASLSEYKLPGKSSGKGLSFNKPASFSRISPTNPTLVVFVQKNQPSSSTARAGIAAAAFPYMGHYETGFSLSTVLAKPNSQEYIDINTSAQDILRQEIQYIFYQGGNIAGVSLEARKPVAFSGSSLDSKNTWKYDFSASYFQAKGVTSPAASNLSTKINGQFLLAYSNNTYYYFIIAADNKDWQPNIAVWQQIANSVKIDQ
jgi:hypothetical protein